MVVVAFKLAQYDPAVGLPCNVDLFPVARRASPREGGHCPRLIQVHAVRLEVLFQIVRQCAPAAIAKSGQRVLSDVVVLHRGVIRNVDGDLRHDPS